MSAVRVERNGPVTTVVLSRPERRNAVDGPTAALLADAFREFDADETASVAVLYGEGGTFCAGADLHALGTSEQNRVEADGDGPMGPTRMRLSKPVIAAVAGHAVAGGLELALWCDLRVLEETAVLGVFCRRWGVPLIDGGTVRLARLIGTSRALDLVLTGRAVDAQEARHIGLAHRVVAPGTVRERAEALAAELAAFRRRPCATTGSRCSSRTVSPRTTRSPTSCGTAWCRCRPPSSPTRWLASATAPAGTVPSTDIPDARLTVSQEMNPSRHFSRGASREK